MLQFRKVTDIHLRSQTLNEIEPGGSLREVQVLGLIATLILLIACINFMNLSTATATRRAKEVGLRKVVGADRKQLILLQTDAFHGGQGSWFRPGKYGPRLS